MGSKPYRFGEQLRKGSLGESILDTFFSRWFDIQRVPVAIETSSGVDRLFIGEQQGDALAVEYKCDTQGYRTGNAFIETISVDEDGKRGWLWTTKADALVYYFHEDGGGSGYVLDPTDLRKRAYRWTRKYPVKTATNDDYHSYGLLVPAEELEPIAEGTFDVAAGELDGFVNYQSGANALDEGRAA